MKDRKRWPHLQWQEERQGSGSGRRGKPIVRRYGVGQTIQLAGVDGHENYFAGLQVNDVGGQRVWAGRDGKGLASISLAAAVGKERIRLQVSAEGRASIVFLDDKGKELQKLAPTD